MNKKILVAYFSASGTTERVAKNLAEAAGAEIYEIKPEKKYTIADLDWTNKNSRSSLEMNDPLSRPGITSKVENMDDYDIVFLGYPIWWYKAPSIINTFLESYNFSGKTVIPFSTSGSSDFGDSEKLLHALCSADTKWKKGKILNGVVTRELLASWIKSLEL